MSRVKIEVVGDTVSARAQLAKLLTTTEELGAVYNSEFAKMSESTLALQVAQGKLAVSTARYSAGSLGAARATLAYRKEVDALRGRQLAALTEVGTAMTRYITAPTLIAGAAAAHLALQFGNSTELIRTQAGASQAEVEAMRKAIVELVASGHSFGQTANEMSTGLYLVESEGIRGARALEILKAAAAGAAVGQTDLTKTADALTSAMRVYDLPTSQATQTMATLNAAVGAGKMHMDDLTAALATKFLPTAKQLGITLPQALAALGVFTRAGIPAESTATALTTSFVKFLAPTKAGAKSLADLGIGTDELAHKLQTGGLPAALATLSKSYETLVAAGEKTRANRDVVLGFGGSKGGATALALVQQYGSFLHVLDQQQKQSNPATFMKDVAAAMNQPAEKMREDLAKVTADAIKLGNVIAPVAADIAGDVTSIAGAFDKLPGPIKHDLGSIILLLAIGGPLIRAGVGVVKMVGGIGRTFGQLPAQAAPGIAATGAELETGIGGAAITANAEVSTLRASLLGLGALAIAPIVIPLEMKVLGGERDWLTKHAGMLGGAGKALLDLATGNLAGNPIHDLGGPIFHGLTSFDNVGTYNAPTGVSAAAEAAAKATAGRAHSEAAAAAQARAATPPLAATAKAVPLTAQQKLTDALIANPNDVGLLKQQAASDRSVLAFAERKRDSGRMDNAKYQEIYKQYMGDLVATENTITSLTTKTARARVSAANERARAAEASYRAVVAEAKAAVDRAKITRGTIKDDELALYDLIAVYGHEANDKVLPADRRATARQDRAATQQQLAALRDQYTVPLRLQLAQSKDAAGDDGHPDLAALNVYRQIRAAALKAIHSGVLAIQGQIQAWDTITQMNQEIQSALGTGSIGQVLTPSAEKLTAGIAGLHGAARREMELRLAQVEAHRGHIANFQGVQGAAVQTVVHHTPIVLDKHVLGTVVTEHQEKTRTYRATQTRGIHAGR